MKSKAYDGGISYKLQTAKLPQSRTIFKRLNDKLEANAEMGKGGQSIRIKKIDIPKYVREAQLDKGIKELEVYTSDFVDWVKKLPKTFYLEDLQDPVKLPLDPDVIEPDAVIDDLNTATEIKRLTVDARKKHPGSEDLHVIHL